MRSEVECPLLIDCAEKSDIFAGFRFFLHSSARKIFAELTFSTQFLGNVRLSIISIFAFIAFGMCFPSHSALASDRYDPFFVPSDNCSSGNAAHICGLKNPEDLEAIPRTRWIIASGVSRGSLYRINRHDHSVYNAFASMKLAWNRAQFASCPRPLDPEQFVGHGIAVRSARQPIVYVINHGQRESIEVFRFNRKSAELTWIGCVPVPLGMFANSVAPISGEGIAVTDMGPPTADTFRRSILGEPTGNVRIWRPLIGWKSIDGSAGSIPNGIVSDQSGRWVYVVRTGTRDVARLSTTGSGSSVVSHRLEIAPDNIRRTEDGRLLVAGVRLDPTKAVGCLQDRSCNPAFQIVSIDPATMDAMTVFNGADASSGGPATTALKVDGQYWLGTFRGNRISIVGSTNF